MNFAEKFFYNICHRSKSFKTVFFSSPQILGKNKPWQDFFQASQMFEDKVVGLRKLFHLGRHRPYTLSEPLLNGEALYS